METKPCRACAEQILQAARKCRYCGEWQLPGDLPAGSVPALDTWLAMTEVELIQRALEESGRDVARAATLLRVDEDDLRRRMRKHAIPAPPAPPLEARPPFLDDALANGLTLEELERRYIIETVRAEAGNKKAAAERLGVDRRTLYRKLDEYGETTGGEGSQDEELLHG